ncbi:arsenic resistance protein [Nocardioides daejeonensis]|uniref:arsenic resistance protein n=1 Tax=Nocardioides daejeonensis TaxID=1046556 RepID=UPI0019507431|nr:arsenic resistance protein [Nocardioides daejeonensis]
MTGWHLPRPLLLQHPALRVVRLTAALEHRQIAVYLGALIVGAAATRLWPEAAQPLERAIYPVLGCLLYATFLQVPFTKVAAAFGDRRFLGAALVLNFVVVPPIVAGLVAIVPLERAVLVGVLLTLLTPCIDYVIVFTGLAGGDSQRLVAASPLLMLAQLVALPVLLWAFLGSDLANVVEMGPFLQAFGFLIMLPLGLAWLTELLATRHRVGGVITRGMEAAMVLLMAATLLVVVASQLPKLKGRYADVAAAVPAYVGFLVLMGGLGLVFARMADFGVGQARALVFSGVTRNSLVVLPLALALPAAYAATPAVVVTQTLVELVAMLALIRLVPRLLPS